MNTQKQVIPAIPTIPASSVVELIRVSAFVGELLRFCSDSSSVTPLPVDSVLPFLDAIQSDLQQIIANIDTKQG